jgi:ribose transport system permease protein
MTTPQAGPETLRPAGGGNGKRMFHRNAWAAGVVVLLAGLLVTEKLVHPELNVFDLRSLVDGALPLGLAAMAQAAVVLSGGIDLSVGPMMSLINVVSALFMAHTDLGGAALISALLIGAMGLAGGLTGAVISVTGVPDIVVTLATSFVWAGLALHIMPVPGGGAPQAFVNLVTGQLGPGLPAGLVVLAAAAVLLWFPVQRSRMGLALYAAGSSRAAAYLSGVDVRRTRIVAYGLGGMFAALGGLALTASTSNGNAASGVYYTLNSVAAIVLGGVRLSGGRGGMLGPLAAAFVLTLINTLLTFLGVDPNFSLIVQGAIVVLVVMVAGLLLVRGHG